jgi:hypothetical protein
VPEVHRLTDPSLTEGSLAAPSAAGGGSSVGQMLALAHDVDAETVALRQARGGWPSGGDDATRNLLETVLRGEEAYVDRLAAGLARSRREASLRRHLLARRAAARRVLSYHAP